MEAIGSVVGLLIFLIVAGLFIFIASRITGAVMRFMKREEEKTYKAEFRRRTILEDEVRRDLNNESKW